MYKSNIKRLWKAQKRKLSRYGLQPPRDDAVVIFLGIPFASYILSLGWRSQQPRNTNWYRKKNVQAVKSALLSQRTLKGAAWKDRKLVDNTTLCQLMNTEKNYDPLLQSFQQRLTSRHILTSSPGCNEVPQHPSLGGIWQGQVGSPDFHPSWTVIVALPIPIVSVETIVGSQNFHPYVAVKSINRNQMEKLDFFHLKVRKEPCPLLH